MNERDDSLHWMVRETDNRIHGPYSHLEILSQLKQKKIRGKMEIAQANTYWFSVNEKEELEKFFPEFAVTGTNIKDLTVTSLTATMTKTMIPSQEESGEAHAEEAQTSMIESGKAEWLSEEFAEEFGLEAEEATLVGEPQAPAAKENLDPLQLVLARKEDVGSVGETKEVFKREHKEQSKSQSFPIQEQKKSSPFLLKIILVILLLGMCASFIVYLSSRRRSNRAINEPVSSGAVAAPTAVGGILANLSKLKNSPEALSLALKQSFLLHDIDLVKRVVSEVDAHVKGSIYLLIAKSMMKKYFLFDADGALAALENARSSMGENKNLEAEIDNLSGIYTAEKDSAQAVIYFKSALENNPREKIYSINLATALYNMGKYAEAEKILLELNRSAITPEYLAPELYLLLGLVVEQTKPLNDIGAETIYARAIELAPQREEIYLLLAARKLRKFGMKEAEQVFRQFLEHLPELEPNNTVVNYRLLSSIDYYGIGRASMHDSLGVSAKPTALYLAVDGLLSAIQNKFAEADGTLQDALNASAGNPDLLKSLGYLRWKEEKYSEIIDLLRDEAKENHTGYAANMLIGKAYQKLGNYSQAEKSFISASNASIDSGDSWVAWGETLLALKQEAEATKKFQRALEKNRFDQRAIQNLYKLGKDSVLSDELYRGFSPF